MSEIIELTKINFSSVFVAVFVILIGIKAIVSLFEWVVEKLGLETKWMRDKKEHHNLLIQTSNDLAELKKQRSHDVEESDEHDKDIKEEMHIFMLEIKDSVTETQKQMQQFVENRIHDREQSKMIQKELTDSIKEVVASNSARDAQINNLIVAQREVLADKINDKYKYYISINGIPEDEVEEFTAYHQAYQRCGGNHLGDAKYEYCMNHLPVIPVETKLVIK